MNSKLVRIVDVFITNGLITKDEITEENYKQIFKSVADDIDSLLYMSILSDIEEYYNIQLPEDVLVDNVFYNIDDFIIILDNEIIKSLEL